MKRGRNAPVNARVKRKRAGIATRILKGVSTARARAGRALYWGAIGALGIATIVGSTAAVYSVAQSPYFELSAIEVRGTERLTEAQVMDLAGISRLPSIFDVPVRHIEEALSRNPWIEEAFARRVFPDRLIVEVKERSPRAIVHLGDLHYVDHEGIVFKRVAPGEPMDFPVVTGLSPSDIEDPEGKELLARSLELVSLWESSERLGADRISEIHIAKGRGLSVITRGVATEIQFGLDNFPLKIEKLVKLLDRIEEQGIYARYIDLSFRNMIVVRPVKTLERDGTVGL